MSTDTCSVCAGTQGPDHKHICNFCGADAGLRSLVVGGDDEPKRFYCDSYCKQAGEGEELGAEDAARRDVVVTARKLKVKASELGVDWRKI